MKVPTLILMEGRPMATAAVGQSQAQKTQRQLTGVSVNKTEVDPFKPCMYHKAFSQVNKVCVGL